MEGQGVLQALQHLLQAAHPLVLLRVKERRGEGEEKEDGHRDEEESEEQGGGQSDSDLEITQQAAAALSLLCAACYVQLPWEHIGSSRRVAQPNSSLQVSLSSHVVPQYFA